jgi:hypothetical protein
VPVGKTLEYAAIFQRDAFSERPHNDMKILFEILI